MRIPNALSIVVGKTISSISRVTHLGAGVTWPGEVALRLNPHILSDLAGNLKKGVIVVAGTNGKTTTALMIKTILEASGERVVHNASGANLENGIVSSLIQNPNADWGVFEVDENSLPGVIKSIKFIKLKVIIVLLNLFRDQLDRYGEVDVIAEKWEKALYELPTSAYIIANADDPLIAHLGLHAKLPVTFFGISDKTKVLERMEHATDSTFCLSCGNRLAYEGVYFSHLGIWRCSKCGQKRPKPAITDVVSPIPGLYNRYNALAAMSVASTLGVTADLSGFSPAFGRQEEIGNVKIFLSKNPAGFNQSLRTVLELGAKHTLLVLNDRIPDGRDVSWIWDVDFEMLLPDEPVMKERDKRMITVSGDRAYDLALRMKYAGVRCDVYESLKEAMTRSLENMRPGETLYILPTYSAMLEVRKILKGRRIL